MKAEDLVGKIIVRVRTIEVGNGGLFSGKNTEDCAYTMDPIFIEASEGGVVYYREHPDHEVKILGARYRDDHWCPVAERFIPKCWREEKDASDQKN